MIHMLCRQFGLAKPSCVIGSCGCKK
jgi:hypothetical protein